MIEAVVTGGFGHRDIVGTHASIVFMDGALFLVLPSVFTIFSTFRLVLYGYLLSFDKGLSVAV